MQTRLVKLNAEQTIYLPRKGKGARTFGRKAPSDDQSVASGFSTKPRKKTKRNSDIEEEEYDPETKLRRYLAKQAWLASPETQIDVSQQLGRAKDVQSQVELAMAMVGRVRWEYARQRPNGRLSVNQIPVGRASRVINDLTGQIMTHVANDPDVVPSAATTQDFPYDDDDEMLYDSDDDEDVKPTRASLESQIPNLMTNNSALHDDDDVIMSDDDDWFEVYDRQTTNAAIPIPAPAPTPSASQSSMYSMLSDSNSPDDWTASSITPKSSLSLSNSLPIRDSIPPGQYF
jgi:hypothetical protein